MTLPNGAAGVDTSQGIFLVSAYGSGDMSPADLVGNDEATVRALYAAKYVTNGTSVFSDPAGPLGQVFSVLGAVPGVGFAFAILGKLLDELVAVIGSIPIIGNIFQTLASFFGLTRQNADNAQSSADTANIGVAALNAQLAAVVAPPGGSYLTDNFDRTGSTLGSDWSQVYFGTGAGSLGTDGNDAHWSKTGSNSRTCHARHVTALNTDTQMCSIVQTGPQNGSNVDPDIRLILRCDSTLANLVVAIVRFNEVEIGYMVLGTYTRLGAIDSVTTANGDRWEFRAGTTTDARQFLLYRNDALVCDRTDSGAASAMGSSNRFVGFGIQAGVSFTFGIGFLQHQPPDIQGWAAADRAA